MSVMSIDTAGPLPVPGFSDEPACRFPSDRPGRGPGRLSVTKVIVPPAARSNTGVLGAC